MLNVLIIPPDNTDYVDSIIELARDAKQAFPEISISILVTTDTYDHYYYSGYFEGLIINPKSVLRKLSLFEVKQFDVALIAEHKCVWGMACLKAGIKNKLNFWPDFSTQDKKQKIFSKLSEISAKNN